MTETWTPAGTTSETWTSQTTAQTLRAFDLSFSNLPDFDTAAVSGIWDATSANAETWTNA